LLLVVIGLLNASSRRRWLSYLGCVGVLLGMWILVSSEMNFNYRFQFPILVVVLLLVVDLGSRHFSRFARLAEGRPLVVRRLAPMMLALLLVVANFVIGHIKLGPPDGNSRAQQGITNVLRTTDGRRLTVATTEAGVICWRSGWNCVDLWGLNNAQIAHHGYLNEAALARLKPDVLVVHAPTSPTARSIDAGAGDFLDGWSAMSTPAIRYAQGSGYVLAAIVDPKPESGFAIYVRPDKEECGSHIRILGRGTLHHRFLRDGRRAAPRATDQQLSIAVI
jgi:hypothetical protein